MTTETTKTDTPYHWMTPEQKEQHLMLCQRCFNGLCPQRKNGRWLAWRLPARTVQIGESKLSLNEGCNIQRAKLLKDIWRELRTSRQPHLVFAQLPMIETVRVGSHRKEFGMRGGRRYFQSVDDYKTVFHNCLPGKTWLREHHRDEYPEPTMEISVGKKTLSLNGNFKRGIIKDFMKGETKQPKTGTH